MIVEAPVAVANRRIDTCHERQRSLRRDERERMLEIGDAARDPLEDEVVVVEIHETPDVIRDHRRLPLNRLRRRADRVAAEIQPPDVAGPRHLVDVRERNTEVDVGARVLLLRELLQHRNRSIEITRRDDELTVIRRERQILGIALDRLLQGFDATADARVRRFCGVTESSQHYDNEQHHRSNRSCRRNWRYSEL